MLHGFQSMKPSLLKIGQLPEENNVGSMRMNYNELYMLKFLCCFNVSFFISCKFYCASENLIPALYNLKALERALIIDHGHLSKSNNIIKYLHFPVFSISIPSKFMTSFFSYVRYMKN